MLVVWPFWECPHCHTRLIPADLYPINADGSRAPEPTPAKTPQPSADREDVRQD